MTAGVGESVGTGCAVGAGVGDAMAAGVGVSRAVVGLDKAGAGRVTLSFGFGLTRGKDGWELDTGVLTNSEKALSVEFSHLIQPLPIAENRI